MNEPKSRIRAIAILQSIAITLVVLGHCVPLVEMSDNPPWVAWGHHFIYTFHMPLFMFLSGYLFILTNRERAISYPRFVLKKAKRLLLPYVFISSVAFLFKGIFSDYALRPMAFDLTQYARGMAYPLENPIILFWFLPTLFLIFLLAPAIRKLLALKNVFAAIATLLLLELLFLLNPVKTPLLNLSGVPEYLIYFYTGCLFSFYCGKRVERLGHAAVALALFLLLLAGHAALERYEQPALRLHLAFLGIIFCFTLAYTIAGWKWSVTRPIDGHSYQIYLLSWFPQAFGRVIYQIGIIDYYFTIVFMLIAGLFIPVLLAKLVERKMAPMGILIGIE